MIKILKLIIKLLVYLKICNKERYNMSVININKMNNFNDIEEMYNNIKKLYMIKRGKDIKTSIN